MGASIWDPFYWTLYVGACVWERLHWSRYAGASEWKLQHTEITKTVRGDSAVDQIAISTGVGRPCVAFTFCMIARFLLLQRFLIKLILRLLIFILIA